MKIDFPMPGITSQTNVEAATMDDTEESPKKKTVGRPTKLDHIVLGALVDNISAGLTYEAACTRSGVDYSTFRRWREKSEDAKGGMLCLFREAILAAEASAIAGLEETLVRVATGGQIVTERKTVTKDSKIIEESITEKAMLPDGRLALMILERRKPELWGKRDKIDVTSGDEPLKVRIFGNCGFGTGNIPKDVERFAEYRKND